MSISLPSFEKLWANYPIGSSDSVKQLIGGNVNLPWVTNTCAIRLSRALNAAGHPIPPGVPQLETVAGGDKARYAFRVAELTRYLTATYGAPKLVKANGQSTKAARDAVAGRKGIIAFEVQGWDDATGHIDLWNGSTARGSEYFDAARQVLFWEIR